MSQARDSVVSLVTLVIFLALIAVVLFLYGGDAEQKAKLEKNVFWQRTKFIVDSSLSIGTKLIGTGLGEEATKDELVNNIDSQVSDLVPTIAPVVNNKSDFLSNLTSKVKQEWEQGKPNAGENLNEIDKNVGSFINFDWQKTAEGAVIIIKTKNGSEHKLPLSFKFSSQ